MSDKSNYQNPNYVKMWKFIGDTIPCNTRALGVNAYGGTYQLPDGSLIIFVPSWNVKKEKEIRQMHVLNLMRQFIRETNLTRSIEELDARAIELIKENIF